MLNVQQVAQQIAAAARTELRAGPSHRCKLRDRDTVIRLLVAFQGGFSQVRAARAAGVSEPVLRLWLRQGATAARGPYMLLRQAVDAIAAERTPRQLVPSPAVPESAAGAAGGSQGAPPVEKPAPVVAPLTVHRWQAALSRAEQLNRVGSCSEAHQLAMEIKTEMQANGLDLQTGQRTLPRLNLPRGLSFDDVRAQYIQWCQMTGRGGPTDAQVEQQAWRWYLEHQALEPATGAT